MGAAETLDDLLFVLDGFVESGEYDAPTPSELGSRVTYRPDFDVAEYAAERDKYYETIDRRPTLPSRFAPAMAIAVPKSAPPSEKLRALLTLEDPF
jgi:hypothetical protein